MKLMTIALAFVASAALANDAAATKGHGKGHDKAAKMEAKKDAAATTAPAACSKEDEAAGKCHAAPATEMKK